MDADEIAEVREHVERCKFNVVISKLQLLALLAALEQARKERHEATTGWIKADRELRDADTLRDAAQKDAKDTRALLVEAKALCESVKMIPLPIGAHAEALHARIEAMLEKKI